MSLTHSERGEKPQLEAVGAVMLPQNSERVLDADEEVFVLYSELQTQKPTEDSNQSFRGLGHVDSRKNILTLSIELRGGEVANSDTFDANAKGEKTRARLMRNRVKRIPDKTVEVEVAQDTTALRSRKGDTGSVLWYASVDFARSVLQDAHLPTSESMFDFQKLKSQHIFELGAGTGVLSLLLSPLCRQYTATDIPELIPLIQKNVSMNFSASTANMPNIDAKPLDWIALKNTPHNRRQASIPIDGSIDLLLAIDCIYHPSLLPSLVETIDFLATPNHTAVLVVSELRSEQVICEFLELWLAIPGWIIHRIPGLLSGPYVVWFGYKDSGGD
ncbi:Diaminohydroxyphosphoribosylamino-pyrimidine deaminase [Leucoagaricus sp. SymC.cos]|nr:Diaminohydroxyphosphoribosylamino-pyrimidine deaminase [Leucoagaricus sp. SymC.cos]